MEVRGGGGTEVNIVVPSGVEAERSVRMMRAWRAAALRLSWPATCSKALKPSNCCAVYIISALLMFGVSFGWICSGSATEPATIGVAIEVPLRAIILVPVEVLVLILSSGFKA